MRLDAIQEVWLLVATGLVFFMQAGFLCLEAGAVRKRNSVNVAMKNFIVELVSTITFATIGFALLFGASQGGWIGWAPPLLQGLDGHALLQFLYQAVFCGTAATIVSGAVAERLRLFPFVLESAFLCAFLYPLFGHWVWGGGWLSQWGYKDFAGSSVVHLMGAGVALAGVLVLGPRQGRFGQSGEVGPIPASDLVLSSLGTFILMLGWIGFNGGSAPFGEATGRIVANTLLAGCFAGVAAMLSSWSLRGVSDIGLILNGTLGGLVAITASADIVPLAATPVVGIAAGLLVHGGTVLLERLRLDDAVGAIPVHGACGVLGILAVPLFATDAAVASQFLSHPENASRLHWLGIQALGASACLLVSVTGGFLIWKVVSLITRLRVSQDGETVGMNYSEHRINDPVSETIAALSLSMASEIDMELVRGTDFEPVAAALNRMIVEVKRRDAAGRRWREDLARIGRVLGETGQAGTAGADGLAASLAEVGRKLSDLCAFARGQGGPGPEAAASRMMGEVLAQLRSDIETAIGADRRLLALWGEVEEGAGRLAEIARRTDADERRGGRHA